MASVTFTAPDISCDHCKRTIEGDLPGMAGIRHVEVAVGSKQVTIDYDETITGPDKLRAGLDDIGYPVPG